MAFLKIFYKNLFRFFKANHSHALLTRVFKIIERKEFFTFHARPRKADQIGVVNDGLLKEVRLAVVLQGPIVIEKNFTLETLKIYQKIFKGHELILSTWEGGDEEVLSQVKKLGVHCLVNKKPDYFGVSNINLQIVSSRSGVKKAKELGAEYVLKTRTDQRMYAPNIAEYLYNVTEVFPVRNCNLRQKKRIVGVSLNTFKYRMYGLSDMLTYGHVDDMLLYWGVEEDMRVFDDEQRKEAAKSLDSFAKWRVCEVYLATEFLRKIDHEILWTLEDSWQVFSDYFCVVDKEQLDLFWPKYGRREYRWLDYTGKINFQELNFREWLNIYANLDNKIIQENFLSE